jgi:predicted O-linked N-acetylglucosamine transferase (SPINDLY family)
VFCCFNNNFKFTPQIFDVWMRLLQEVEGSILWMSAPNESAVRNLRSEAERRGISGERLIFAQRLAQQEDHLARQRLAGLFLDTLPYNAHSTAADALWAGLPVLTCPGASFAGRVAGSLLHAVGLPEMITRSLQDYEALALKLAREPDVLARLKTKLSSQRTTSPLFDTARTTRHIEAAYRQMCERQRRGGKPKGFSVAP